jgi:ATP-dependent DNA ligase
LSFKGKDVRKLPLLSRRKYVQQALRSAAAERTDQGVQCVAQQGTRLYDAASALQLEGSWRSEPIRSTKPDRSGDWIKIRTPYGRDVQAKRSEAWGG